jgi:cobalt-zinc-cadmium efflux system protein
MAQAHAQGRGVERGNVSGGPDALRARREGNRRRMLVAAAINAALVAAGVVGGIVTGSLALLADAGHVLSDLGAIGLALLAATLAARSGGPRRTFGYQRTEVIAALLNGVTLVAIAVLIVVAAIDRLGDPPEVKGAGVLVLGTIGLAANAAATWRPSSGIPSRTRSARSG